jgi:hypothetical protein
MGKKTFEIQVGRDATTYYTTTIEADSLEEAKNNLNRHGYECKTDTVWTETGTDVFDDVETCVITSPDGSTVSYSQYEGWVENND